MTMQAYDVATQTTNKATRSKLVTSHKPNYPLRFLADTFTNDVVDQLEKE